MNLLVIILTFCCVFYGESVEWKERSISNQVFSEPDIEIYKSGCSDSSDELCKSTPEMSNALSSHFLKKKNSPYNFAGATGNGKFVPFFQSLHQCPCSCKMDYPLIDLGRKYFPRKIQTGVCKTDSCDNHHKCVEKKYKVTVIRQRESTGEDLPEIRGLPESLQSSWISDSISITIACQCVPNI